MDVTLILEPGTFPRLLPDVEMTVFRLVQEAITNVYRHSGSKTANIVVRAQTDSVIVQVRDYGKGIPTDIAESSWKSSRQFGVGISGMRERVRQFGGELVMTSEDPGTLVQATIPLF